MKTIDLLVQELPALGGWPDGAVEAGFLCSDDTLFFVNKDGDCPSGWRINMNHEVEDSWIEVTREQYEAALAEKEHPLPWDEKNKPCPTIGAECRGCPDCGRRVSCTSDDITDDAVRTEMGMNSRALDAALAAKNDGWIEWGGGECPVPCGTAVDVKHRCGAVSENQQAWPKHHKESDVVVNPFSNAGQAFWRHENSVVDIIAYRLHQPKEAEHSEESEEDLNECIGQDAAQVWGGEGKPAIGEKCEHHSGGQWEAVTIAGIYENLVTGFTDYWMVKEDGSSYTVGNPYRFRQIRSEADKKREDALDAIYGAIASAERAHNRSDEADKVYEAIAAGKIPGVKLED